MGFDRSAFSNGGGESHSIPSAPLSKLIAKSTVNTDYYDISDFDLKNLIRQDRHQRSLASQLNSA